MACWADVYSLYVDVYELDPSFVLDFSLEEVSHVAINKSVFKNWSRSIEEQAMEEANKGRR